MRCLRCNGKKVDKKRVEFMGRWVWECTCKLCKLFWRQH